MPGEGPLRPTWNLLVRLVLAALALSSLLFLPEFADHVRAHFTGSIAEDMITGRWHVVAVNVLIFVAFLVPLSFRRKVDWKEYGLVTAFFVSLFVEMYGVPLLLTLVAGRLAPSGGGHIETPVSYEVLGVSFGLTVPMVYGVVLMGIGTALVLVAWVQLYRGLQRVPLVTTGIYSLSRNPQYLGFMLVVAGWLVGWPTVLVVVLAPILLAMYVRLCYVEEGEVRDLPGFDEYRRRVPLIL